ncbi:MAG: adenylate/guanylate cyclase domain-containing protein [Chitinophagaceae bacterium]|nr:adenylate/guanylate cyclase domain-containing protein [Chitinophagaceae bacterium]
MTQSLRLKLTKLLIIIICWAIMGFLIGCYDYFVLRSELSAGMSAKFSLSQHLFFSIMTGLMGAVMGGSFLVFYVNEKYRDRPYGFTVMAVVLSFIIVVTVIAVVLAAVVAPLQTGKSFAHPETQKVFRNALFDPIHLKNITIWSLVVAVTQILLQFNTKFGEGNLWNMVRGKYQTPKEEQRIFMFVDINGSTSIAEKLGDEKYHQLLKDYFADLTNPILDNKGEIYQYVGDEIIISWKYKEGYADSNCFDCFFDMKKEIKKRSVFYSEKYGLVPGFKAGLHFGRVMAGEVGIIKRDITFSGDVLNTTSRIQGKCKELNAEIIASGDLINAIPLNGKYKVVQLGSIQLRGKEKEVGLCTVVQV